jgi:hypothetical protein
MTGVPAIDWDVEFATDGVRGEFSSALNERDTPGVLAARILERHAPGDDDALVLVARTLETA